jgi:hypothetical protein
MGCVTSSIPQTVDPSDISDYREVRDDICYRLSGSNFNEQMNFENMVWKSGNADAAKDKTESLYNHYLRSQSDLFFSEWYYENVEWKENNYIIKRR